MAYEYRNQATNGIMFNDLLSEQDCHKYDEEFVSVDDVKQVMDNIESDVSDIKDLLEDIKGIEVIEDAQRKLNVLYEKL